MTHIYLLPKANRPWGVFVECWAFLAMDAPEDFECPVCGLGKTVFKKTAFEKEE